MPECVVVLNTMQEWQKNLYMTVIRFYSPLWRYCHSIQPASNRSQPDLHFSEEIIITKCQVLAIKRAENFRFKQPKWSFCVSCNVRPCIAIEKNHALNEHPLLYVLDFLWKEYFGFLWCLEFHNKHLILLWFWSHEFSQKKCRAVPKQCSHIFQSYSVFEYFNFFY